MTLPAAQPAPASEAIEKTGTATVDPLGGLPGKAKDGEGRSLPDAGLRSLDHCTFARRPSWLVVWGAIRWWNQGSYAHAPEEPCLDGWRR